MTGMRPAAMCCLINVRRPDVHCSSVPLYTRVIVRCLVGGVPAGLPAGGGKRRCSTSSVVGEKPVAPLCVVPNHILPTPGSAGKRLDVAVALVRMLATADDEPVPALLYARAVIGYTVSAVSPVTSKVVP